MVAVVDHTEVEVQFRKITCQAKTCPCPDCGKNGRRKEKFCRNVRSIAYGKVLVLEVHYAEYRARCGCCKTFRSSPPGIDLKCHYDNQVRQAVLNRLLEDGMSVERTLAALKRDFLLDLSTGFVYDCLERETKRLDMEDYRRWTLENFSGTLCVDELHLGKYTLLLATDPLNDFPVAFAVVDRNDQAHMKRFLQNLKNHGFSPEVVITDGSNLYPALLAELWPEARHQLCIFHVQQDINRHVLDALKRLRRKLAKRGNRGRKRRRGRCAAAQRKKRKKTLKEKSHFVFKHRYLIVKRRENLTDSERKKLFRMFEYLPGLCVLRKFMDKTYALFDPDQTVQQAGCRRAALVGDKQYAAIPELAKVQAMLSKEKFARMIAFLHSPAARRVRTNNHVERANRKLRYLEKVRYKWRRRRCIIRFVLLSLDRWRKANWKQVEKTRCERVETGKIKGKSTTSEGYALSG